MTAPRGTCRLRLVAAVSLTLLSLSASVAGRASSPSLADSGAVPNMPAVQDDPGPRRRPQVKVSGWVAQSAQGDWLVGGWPLGLDSMAVQTESLRAGTYASTVGTLDDGRLMVSALRIADIRPESGYTVEFRGIIEEVTARHWIVGGRLVFVTESTSVQGRAEPGALAEVKGVRFFGDITVARSIRVIARGAFAEVQFEGIIESMADGAWVVGGVTVTVSTVTTVEGAPAVGLLAEVQGLLQPDGSVLAQRIHVKETMPTSYVDVEGVVSTIAPTHWVVGVSVVFVDEQTFIDDSRAPAEVGMWAQVRARRLRDGSLLALRIRLTRPS